MRNRWMRQASAVVTVLAVACSGIPGGAAFAETEEKRIYRLRNVESGEYLTVDGEMAQKEGNLIIKGANGTLKQEFAVTGEDGVTLISQSNQRDLAVNVWGSRTQEGSNINLWEQTDEATQKWIPMPVAGGYVLQSADNRDYVIGTYLGNVQTERYRRGDQDQIWELIEVKEAGTAEVTALSLEAESHIVSRNHTMELSLVCEPEDGDLGLAAWESSNPEVLSVDQNGVVTAKDNGTAVISAVLPQGICASIALEVRDVELEGITVADADDKDAGSCQAGSTFWLTAGLLPEDATENRLEWSTSDPEVCIVDKYGRVTAVSEGAAEVNVQAGEFTASYTVTVSDDQEATIPEGSGERHFVCSTPEEWAFVSAVGGEEYLMRDDGTGERWLPSEILDVQDYDESYDSVLDMGYLGGSGEGIQFYPIDYEKYMTVLSDTPDWYGAIKDTEAEPVSVDLAELETGIWVWMEGADGCRYQYRIRETDFEEYRNGFQGDHEVYYGWMQDGMLTGLFQAEPVVVTEAPSVPETQAETETMAATEPVTEVSQEPSTDGGTEIQTETQPASSAESVTEPVTESAAEMPPESSTEPVTELLSEPVTESIQEELSEMTTELSTELSDEPSAEQTTEEETDSGKQTEGTSEDVEQEEVRRILYQNEAGFSLMLPAAWEGRYTVKTAQLNETDTEIAYFCKASDDISENTGLLFDIVLAQNPAAYLKENDTWIYPADLSDGRAILAALSGSLCAEGEGVADEYQDMSASVNDIIETLSVYVCDTEAEQVMFELLREDDMLPVEAQTGIVYTPAKWPEELTEDELAVGMRKLHCWVPQDVQAFVPKDTFEEMLPLEHADTKTGYVRLQEDQTAALELVVSREDPTLTGEKLPLDLAALEGCIWLCSASMTGRESQYYFTVSNADYQGLLEAWPDMITEMEEMLMEAVYADGQLLMIYDTAQQKEPEDVIENQETE